jgi:hypothetical protein
MTEGDRSGQAFKADDVLIPDAHEYVVSVPEDGPTIFFFHVGGLHLVLVLELVTADVQAVGVHVSLPSYLVEPTDGRVVAAVMPAGGN